MKRFAKLTALCLSALLLALMLFGCQDDADGTIDSNEPAPSTASQPFTPEEVFRKLTGAGKMRLAVIYTETGADGAVGISETTIVEKDDQLVKVTLQDNDEQNVYYYDLNAKLGYQTVDGEWESVSVAETMPDWVSCLQQAFTIQGMNERLEWLFSSDTYEPYDAKTGKCVMKSTEMTDYFGANWTDMTAYLMQSGDTYYLYMSTTDEYGTFSYKMSMEYVDVSVTLPN